MAFAVICPCRFLLSEQWKKNSMIKILPLSILASILCRKIPGCNPDRNGAGRHALSSNAEPLLPHFRIVARLIPDKRPEGALAQHRFKTELVGQIKILAAVDLD